MATGIEQRLFDGFDEFNDFDVTVEPDAEKRDTYFCEVWAYSDDAVINDICVNAQGTDDGEMAKDITLELYRKIAEHRRVAK
jgi:hypothetical protein